MKNNKKGISLIVLVITIIVMVVLSAAVVISLTNTGIIDKAGQAVELTDVKQIEQLAALTWSEAYINGDRDDDLVDNVLEALKDYTDKYNIKVSNTGVTVTQKGEVVDYFVYEYDATNMTATLVGVKEEYRETSYYLHNATTQSGEPFASAIVGEDGTIITDVVIPSTTKGADGKIYSVTRIECGAFAPDCDLYSSYLAVSTVAKYTSFTIPNSIVEIGEGAFAKCQSLKSVVLPKNLTILEKDAFFDCKNLTTITIPKGVTNIPHFNDCNNLTDIYFEGTQEEWESKTNWYAGNTIHYNYAY